MALRHLFIGAYLDEQILQRDKAYKALSEELRVERGARAADRLAWEADLKVERSQWQAKIDALHQKLLFMAGIPDESLMAQAKEETPYEPPEPFLPGVKSMLADEIREAAEEAYLQREWLKLQRAAEEELTKE